jgi:putative transposase
MFLDKLAEQYPDNLNIIQLDNGRFHHGSKLKIPDNVILIFQPPYSPELNPIERVWQHIKQELSWHIYDDLDGLKEKVCAYLKRIFYRDNSIYNWMGLHFVSPSYCCMIFENWY